MNYHKPELLEHLASTYVLGTLRGAARRRFEQLLREDALAQEQLAFWQQRLGDFADLLPPRSPPASAWTMIEGRTRPAAATLPLAQARRTPQTLFGARRHRRWPWFAAGFGAAASLVLAFLVGQQNPTLPAVLKLGPAAQVATSPASSELPMVVARLQMPTSSMGWLVSITPDHHQLTAVAGQDFLPLGRRSIQLWLLSPGKEPVSLGLLPSTADTETSFALPVNLDDPSEISLGISLEPPGGAPGGKLSRALLGSSSGI